MPQSPSLPLPAPLVLDALRARARDPADVFCWFKAAGATREITCAEALEAAARWETLFRARALGDGDLVLIILRHSPDLYFAFLGAMLAGATPSFMPPPTAKQDPALYRSQHRLLFGQIDPKAVVTFAGNAPVIAEIAPGLPVLTPEAAAACAPAGADRAPPPGQVAFLQHSSGTTGLKKGVMLSFGAVAAQCGTYGAALGLSPSDRIVSWLPLYHDMGLIACFMLPLSLGVPIVSLDAFEWVARPRLLLDAIAAHGGTHVWLPNFAFHHLIRTVGGPPVDLSGVKAFIDCSEPCRIETFEQFETAFAPWGVRKDQLRVCYAMAETVFAVTQTPPGEDARAVTLDDGRRIISVGAPLPGVELRIAGGEDIGEVEVRAPFLFAGYHGDRARTAARLRDGWYLTGDVGFLREGELYLLGRTDDLLIVNGRNLFAHHVEFALNAEAPEIKAGRCVALGVWNPDLGSQELVVVAEAEGDAADLSRRAKSIVLSGFGVTPREVRMVPQGWIAKTTSGKIARELNLRKYLDERTAGS